MRKRLRLYNFEIGVSSSRGIRVVLSSVVGFSTLVSGASNFPSFATQMPLTKVLLAFNVFKINKKIQYPLFCQVRLVQGLACLIRMPVLNVAACNAAWNLVHQQVAYERHHQILHYLINNR